MDMPVLHLHDLEYLAGCMASTADASIRRYKAGPSCDVTVVPLLEDIVSR